MKRTRRTQAHPTKTVAAARVPAAPATAAPAVAAEPLLTIEAAIARLQTTRSTFYRWLRTGKLRGQRAGRQWRFRPSDLERFIAGQGPEVALTVSPAPLVAALAAAVAKAGLPPVPAGDDPLAAALYAFMRLGVAQHASDLHLTPVEVDGERHGLLQARVDGLLTELARCDHRLVPALVARWKPMAGMNPQETALPQDGRMEVALDGRPLDLRLSVVPTVHGETATARLLDQRAARVEFARLGLPPADKARIEAALRQPSGLILVCGPTGSGKTTTLYALIGELNTPQRRIMTVEHPVEYLLPGTVQLAARPEAGLPSARLIRAALRCAPDVLVIGDADAETAGQTAQAAAFGHLVLAPMHAADALDALARLAAFGVSGAQLADVLALVVGQRLVRRLCPACRQPAAPTADEAAFIARAATAAGLTAADVTAGAQFHAPGGCDQCRQTGYRGRIGVVETMVGTPELRHALATNAGAAALRRVALAGGMQPLPLAALRRAVAGETSLREVIRVMADLLAG